MESDKLKSLIQLAPLIQKAIPLDVMIGITDTEKYLLYLPANSVNLGDIKGSPIPKEDALYKAITRKKSNSEPIPNEINGIPFKSSATPITDEKGNVVGAFGIGVSVEKEEMLRNMAQQFASATEEVSASTEELSSSAQDLSVFMKKLSRTQEEVSEHVKKTEHILGFIHSIAASSRILGLNAGIEAARSGEHGRGFSVVAKEITKLANDSAKSVDEVKDILSALKQQVDHIAIEVKKITEITQQQFASTEEISSAMNQLANVAEHLEEIAASI